MNANELTFGCEIECMVPETLAMPVGGAHTGIQVRQLPEGWKACSDGSILRTVGFKAVEIVSPVLTGIEGLQQVAQVMSWLRSVGAKVNASCGFHVHVGFPGRTTAEIGRVVSLVARHEDALFAITGQKSRESNYFCKPIKNDWKYTETFQGQKSKPMAETLFNKGSQSYPTERYHTLNLCNLASGGKPTVEFRIFGGTTNTTKAVGYIRACLGIVERAIASRRSLPWNLNDETPAIAAKHEGMGPGEKAASRLVYGLGWKKGEASREWGSLHGEGLPTDSEVITEFTRLARKFDGAVA